MICGQPKGMDGVWLDVRGELWKNQSLFNKYISIIYIYIYIFLKFWNI